MPDTVSSRSLRRAGIAAGAVAVAVVAIGIGGRVQSERRLAEWTAAQSTPVVATIHATPMQGGEQLTLPGNIQAFNSAAVYPRTNGYVRKWLVDIGDSVRAGQVLATIDAPEVDQQVAAAQADLQTARANQALARSTAERWSTMLAKDAVSRQEADEKAGDLAAKSAITNAASANLARLRALQGFTRIVAPFAGVVTSRSTQIGQLVTANNAAAAPLFTISDVNRMRVYVRVPQSYSAQIHPGMHASLTLPEYAGRSFDATLTRTAGAVDPQSGTVLVELQAANPDRALKPGAYAQALFPLPGASGSVKLPASALLVGAEGTRVAVVGRGGKAELRPIRIGRDLGDSVEVTAGLSATDQVINNPPDAIQSGDPVRVAGTAPTHAAG